ncbi:MAG TPA: alkaline phosphatase family protein [Candidatus Cybelea sp.]|nr:alkaline phosphatase family protein [Candidatus Cybelea sp.]
MPPASPASVAATAGLQGGTASGKIRHVVVVVQENRSFNNLFYGFPGARTTKYGYDSKGKRIELQPVSLKTRWDIDHSSYSFFAACNGRGTLPGTHCRMNGFDKEQWYCGHASQPPCPDALPPYSYVPNSETKPYFFLGKNYVLGDEMFTSNFDASSFISHQYIIAAQASSTVNYPLYAWGCPGGLSDTIQTLTPERQFGPETLACFDNRTLGDELDNAGLSWRYYTSRIMSGGGYWSAYQAIRHIYDGPDWHKDVITPQTRFFNDVSAGRLRTVSWITPTCKNSDHAGCDDLTGPSWVGSIVNAIGKSAYWNDTAIFILWDDYGGWYDPVPPKKVDYDGLGIRVPLLIVSAYAKKGYVSHVHYEHGSILRFIEDVFNLPQLAESDTRANSPQADAFDFTAKPRKFVAVPTERDIRYFLRQPLDERPPDTE